MEKKHIFKQEAPVTRQKKESIIRQKGIVYWLTGLSGSGKSTIASELEKTLNGKGILTQFLDGDNVRSGLCSGLGFSLEDRNENLRRVSEVCKLSLDAGLVVIASFISPMESDRKMANEIIGDDFIEVFVDASLDTCEKRDVKGLYAKARSGEIKNFTGIDSPYQTPKSPQILLNTETLSIEECVAELLRHYSSWIMESDTKRKISQESNWSHVNYGNNRMNLSQNQHAVFIGRFQPLHRGHESLFRQKLNSGIPLLVLVRDIEPDKNNPLTTKQTVDMIEKVFQGEAVNVGIIPDIESVNWGRGVGYELNEFYPPENIGNISATKIREMIEVNDDRWMESINPKIHQDIIALLSPESVSKDSRTHI